MRHITEDIFYTRKTLARFLLLLLFVAWSWPALGETTERTLSSEFEIIARDALARQSPERANEATLLLDRIASEFPDSFHAILLERRGRLPNLDINIAAVRALAQGETVRESVVTSVPVPRVPVPKAPSAANEGLTLIPSTTRPAPKPGTTNAGLSVPKPQTFSQTVPRNTGTAQKAVRAGPADASFFQRLRSASVLIYFVGRTRQGGVIAKHVGSGSFISPDLVLTNTHVAEAFATYDGKWLIINEKIGVRSARIVSMAKHHTPINIDAAVMQVDDFKNDTWLTFNTKSALDDQIFIAGYPGDATLLDQRYAILTNALQSGRLPDTSRLPTAVVNEGRINNFIEDSSSKAVDLQYTMVTGPGNSGSPIVNACGQIVGLHYHGGARGADIKFNGAVHAKNVRVYLEYYVGVQADFSQEHCR